MFPRATAYGYARYAIRSLWLRLRLLSLRSTRITDLLLQNGRCGQQRTEMQATVFHAPKIENPSSGPQKVYLVLYESLRYEQFHSGKQGLVRELILEGFHLLAQPNPRFHGSVAMRHKPTSLVSLVVVYSTIQPRILVRIPFCPSAWVFLFALDNSGRGSPKERYRSREAKAWRRRSREHLYRNQTSNWPLIFS